MCTYIHNLYYRYIAWYLVVISTFHNIHLSYGKDYKTLHVKVLGYLM